MDDNDTSITSVTPSPPPSPTIPQTPQSIDQQHPNTISSPDPSDVATDDHNSTVSPPTIPSIHIHTSSPLSSPRATRHLNNDIESNTQNHQSINNINDNNDIQLTPIKPIHNSDLLHNDLPPPPQKRTPQVVLLDIISNKWFDRAVIVAIIVNCVFLALFDPLDKDPQSPLNLVLAVRPTSILKKKKKKRYNHASS
eukprot:TRINITY_DN2679_c0_g1_i3.p1 TRINITY_DN2679_c0_g1~~TRINITY_DN2679_c0_g1_i3.p1  ORF type:complete len:203 (-),score=20.45 TRINITY_DN2679_c0_g1_i3:413-1000(-)